MRALVRDLGAPRHPSFRLSRYNSGMRSGKRLVFDRFELDPDRRRLTAAAEPVAISDRQFAVLLALVARAGQIVAKEDLLQAGWQDVAVGDNSLEQVISALRRLLGHSPGGGSYIETVPRRGYRFGAEVAHRASRQSDAALDALLIPYRAFIEGRAAIEALQIDQVARARAAFEDAVLRLPEHASAHVGLANACIMQFEMTRVDPQPSAEALRLALEHAREACRLDPQLAEAWATLGFVLRRTGDSLDASAALKRAVTLEPDNWQHHVRLASVSWGEERLRAARRSLSLLPDFPIARWLAATVYVARQGFDQAERELTSALAAPASPESGPRFGAVAIHWLSGLVCLARGEAARAHAEFDQELALEDRGHLYARECCANTWYALGASCLRQHRFDEARAAFEQALQRVPTHPLALIGAAAAGAPARADVTSTPIDAGSAPGALVQAVRLAVGDEHERAARVMEAALMTAAAGDAAWILPVEPLLHVTARPDLWARPLALVRERAA
jgi:DNA-binding winged helix-turn-helix (wHTH) protein/Flp pilus assembly protein TadD